MDKIKECQLRDRIKAMLVKEMLASISDQAITSLIEEQKRLRTQFKRYLSNDKRYFEKYGEHKFTDKNIDYWNRKITEITATLEGVDDESQPQS